MLFFQVIARRYQHTSTSLASNKGLEGWGEILGDEVMAAKLIDRPLHHCPIVNIRGNSYRLREHAELGSAIRQQSTPRQITAEGGDRAPIPALYPPFGVCNCSRHFCAT